MSDKTTQRLADVPIILESAIDINADHLLLIDNSDSGLAKRISAGNFVHTKKPQQIENKVLKNCLIMDGSGQQTDIIDFIEDKAGSGGGGGSQTYYVTVTPSDIEQGKVKAATLIEGIGMDPATNIIPYETFNMIEYVWNGVIRAYTKGKMENIIIGIDEGKLVSIGISEPLAPPDLYVISFQVKEGSDKK